MREHPSRDGRLSGCARKELVPLGPGNAELGHDRVTHPVERPEGLLARGGEPGAPPFDLLAQRGLQGGQESFGAEQRLQVA